MSSNRNNRKISAALVCCFLFVLFHNAGAQVRAFVGDQKIVQRFENERLEFDLVYKGLKSVVSRMWLEENGGLLSIIWTVKTKALYGILFKIDNRYEIVVDDSGRLVQVNKSIDQKNIKQEWQIYYDWANLTTETNRGYGWPILPGCQNVLSMLYDVRCRSLADGDSLSYILDVESQIWRIEGRVRTLYDAQGNFSADEIVFSFHPATPIQARRWKTDLLTNRLARQGSTLVIRLGEAPGRLPLLLRFSGKDDGVEMRLAKHLQNRH